MVSLQRLPNSCFLILHVCIHRGGIIGRKSGKDKQDGERRECVLKFVIARYHFCLAATVNDATIPINKLWNEYSHLWPLLI